MNMEKIVATLEYEIWKLQQVVNLLKGRDKYAGGVRRSNPLAHIHQSEAIKKMWAARRRAEG